VKVAEDITLLLLLRSSRQPDAKKKQKKCREGRPEEHTMNDKRRKMRSRTEDKKTILRNEEMKREEQRSVRVHTRVCVCVLAGNNRWTTLTFPKGTRSANNHHNHASVCH
jgi:hypothetical protein